MKFKQITWKSSATLTVSTLTLLAVGSICSNLFLPSRNSSLGTISLANTQPLRTLQGHSTWIYVIALTREGRFLGSGW